MLCSRKDFNFYNLVGIFFYDPGYGLSWYKFSGHLKNVCSAVVDGVFCRCVSDSVG